MRLKQVRRRLGDPLVAGLFKVLVCLVGLLPDWGVRRLAYVLSLCLWYGYRGGRRLVLANLQVAFPEWNRDVSVRTGRACFFHLAWNGLDFLRSIASPRRFTTRILCDTHARDLVQRLENAPGPMIVVTPHLGSWELFGHAMSLAGIPCAAVAHPLRNPHLDRMILRARQVNGMKILSSAGAARSMVRELRHGTHIGILIDQNTRPREGGVFADFFGLPVTVTRAVATLARRLGNVGMLVAACVRENGRFVIRCRELPQSPADYASDEALVQALVAANEDLIRAYPEQYVWAYKRWRYIPPDASSEQRGRYPFYARIYEP